MSRLNKASPFPTFYFKSQETDLFPNFPPTPILSTMEHLAKYKDIVMHSHNTLSVYRQNSQAFKPFSQIFQGFIFQTIQALSN